jgi:hypothetical protein
MAQSHHPSSQTRPKTGAAYFGNRFLSHAEEDLARMAECCDYVVHTFSEDDVHFHKKVLSQIFAATRRRGMEVWADPWGLGGVFGGEALSRFLLDHPDDWQVLSDGRRVPAACLNRRAFRDFVLEWVHTVQNAGAQVILWDEPHIYFRWGLEWDGIYSCVCPACQSLFREKFGRRLPLRLDAEAEEFRRQTITGFLTEMMEGAHRGKLVNALCLYAYEGHDAYDKIWTALSTLAPLDIFGCDPYWRWPPFQNPPAAHVERFSKKTVDAGRSLGRGSQVWIQAMRLPRGAEPEIEAACQAAARAGATHLAAWSYDGGALLDTVLAEDPARVWATVAQAFKALRG